MTQSAAQTPRSQPARRPITLPIRSAGGYTAQMATKSLDTLSLAVDPINRSRVTKGSYCVIDKTAEAANAKWRRAFAKYRARC